MRNEGGGGETGTEPEERKGGGEGHRGTEKPVPSELQV